MAKTLETVQVETGPNPTASIIWLHGLGADGHDFEPIVPEVVRPSDPVVRFVFPHAPIRPITFNQGHEMRAWYDVIAIDRETPQDEAGIRQSNDAVKALIKRENERGIPTNKIFLAGFSQGGALAVFTGLRYPEKLGGIIGLSCHMLLAADFDTERQQANQTTPIFLAHGTEDPIVPFSLGEECRQLLETRGYTVDWHTYRMSHSVCVEEIAHLAGWLRKLQSTPL